MTAHLDGRLAVLAVGLPIATGYVLQIASDSRAAETALSPLCVISGPALAGWLLRRARAQTAQLQQVTAEAAAEREYHARTVALAERARIARELHDVIAHTVSVMVVQGRCRRADAPGRRAGPRPRMGDPRRRTGGPRRAAPPAGRAPLGRAADARPQPGLAEIPWMVAAAGVRLDVEGRAYDVPAGLDLTAYRITP